MTNTGSFRVRFTTVNRRTDQVVAVERAFRTDAARARFLDREDESGRLVEVLAFSDEA